MENENYLGKGKKFEGWPGEGLKHTTGSIDFMRLVGKRSEFIGAEPWEDHCSLWIKNGKPYLFVSEPYDLDISDMKGLIRICEAYGLEFNVRGWSRWNPGDTSAIFITKVKA